MPQYIRAFVCIGGQVMPFLPGTTGERICNLREHNRRTRAELAEKAGVDPSRIGRIENGDAQRITNDVIVALAGVFNVTTDFLLGLSDDADPKNIIIGDLEVSVKAAKNLRGKP